MPNRIIKESICTSEEIDGLAPMVEVFFYRLMVVCDDFGLMDARPAILKARCYPLKSIDFSFIQDSLNELQISGLVNLYQVDGKPYLHIVNWEKHQTIRAKKSKYPNPQASEINCKQTKANAPVIQSNPIQNPIQSNPSYEEANASTQSQLFSRGLSILTSRGVEAGNARSFIGLMRKKRGDIKAMELLLMVDEQDISQPLAWLSAVMDERKSSREYKSQRDKLAETGAALTGQANTRVIEGTAIEIN